MWNWPVEKKVFDTRVKCEGLTLNKVSLPVLEPGVYRLRMTLDERGKETLADTLVVVYSPKGSRKVFHQHQRGQCGGYRGAAIRHTPQGCVCGL